MKEFDLSDEVYREYDMRGVTYRIDHPVKLFIREGGTTHRVLDRAGVVHCITFPYPGTVLRWKPIDPLNPVAF